MPTPRPSPPRRSGDTAERILDAAEACFAQHGYAGTSLRDVADGVGIRIPSLYNHFPNKAALYSAVLERGMTPILAELARFAEEADGLSVDLPKLTHDIMTLLGRRPNLPRLIQYELLAGGDQLTAMLEDWLRPTIVRGLSMLQASSGASRWRPDALPMLVLTFLNIVLGHFTTAPLYEQLIGKDPLSRPALVRQTAFFAEVFAILSEGPNPPDSPSTTSSSPEDRPK